MTVYDQDPIAVLRDGLNAALFLKFRAHCKFLRRNVSYVGATNLCSHDGNKWAEAKPGGGYPNCALLACPIYERLSIKDSGGDEILGFEWIFDAFTDRWEEMPRR